MSNQNGIGGDGLHLEGKSELKNNDQRSSAGSVVSRRSTDDLPTVTIFSWEAGYNQFPNSTKELQ